MKMRIPLCAIFLMAVLNLSAQDPIFSQFSTANVYLNPASTGMYGGLSVTALSRQQWGRVTQQSPFPGSFETYFASAEWAFNSSTNSLGLFFMRDVEGDANLRTNYGGLSYCFVLASPDKKLNQHNLRMGFGLYYAQKRIDWNALLFSDQLHPKGEAHFLAQSQHAQFFESFQDNPPWWTGLNLGLLYRFSEIMPSNGRDNGLEIELGVQATHLINILRANSVESLQGFNTGLASRFTVHGSLFSPTLQFGTKRNRFSPIFRARIEAQGPLRAFTLGTDLLYRQYGLGFYYHNTASSTFIGSTQSAIIQLQFPLGTLPIYMGMSYDINLGGLAGFSGNTLEVSLKYQIPTSRFRSGVLCPPVGYSHRKKYENTWHKKAKNKNLN